LVPAHDEDPHWGLGERHVGASLQVPAKPGKLQIIHITIGVDWNAVLAGADAE